VGAVRRNFDEASAAVPPSRSAAKLSNQPVGTPAYAPSNAVAGSVTTMNAAAVPEWLDQHIWPQIQTMLLNDACFKLMGRARELTGEFNGPIAELIEVGYVTSQTMAIRRLCDDRRDVISLRRALIEARASNFAPSDPIDALLSRLDCCEHVCRLVNDYVAHTANPLRRPNLGDWNLQVAHLIDAQRTICQVAISLDRDLLRRRNYVKIVPVPQFDIMQEFRRWVPEAMINALWQFWHAHNDAVNAWIP
jgi:hypothetical protein